MDHVFIALVRLAFFIKNFCLNERQDIMNELYLSIQQAQKDPSQMETLIEKFRPLILKYARHLNKTERDDAIQDMIVAFILVIKKMDLNNFPQEASEKYLLSYIQKAMYTRFLDLSKRQTQIITMDIDDFVYVERVDDALSPSEMVELREMLTGLTALQRKVLVIRYLYGYSDAEIADQLHISRQAVNRAKNRAVAVLKEKYL